MTQFNPLPGGIFARAQQVPAIIVEISLEDVMSLNGGINAHQARLLIERHGHVIARTMLCHGLSTTAQLLQEEPDGN